MKNYSSHTPSRRHMTQADLSMLTGDKPYKPLLKRLKAHGGRNSAGRITMRHQGGGHKKMYRMVDFRQLNTAPAVVETLEYDPYRTAFIARIRHDDGARAYILAPQGLKVGEKIQSGANAPLKTGNRLKLRNIPVGFQIYNVELQPGQGGKLLRSAGSSAQVLANDAGYTDIKMASGEVRRVQWEGMASIGQVSNPEWSLTVFGKAGRSRWLGIRPTTRGKAMNPVDHPYGGGEGNTQRGTRRPKDIWGNVTGGKKTRNKRKASSRLIVSRRPSRKKAK